MTPEPNKSIVIACDHGGVDMKSALKETLKEDGYGHDMHYSPNGHKQLAEIYERFLKD